MISVIIPVYNVAGFLRQAVDSALAQTCRDIEVIVVDDGSTDCSADTLRDLDDPRLRVIREEHAGSAAARNAGLRSASGELVAFLDADDLWAPGNLERQSAFLASHPEVDMTFGHSLVVDEEGRSLGFRSSTCSGPVSLPRLLRTNEIGNGSCLLLRREALDRAGWFDPKLSACVDIDVWMRMASLRPGNVVAIPEVLTFYRRRQGQISGDWRRMEAGYLQLLERLRRIAPLDVQREENRSRAGRYRYYARLARESGEAGTAARLLATAFCWAPLWLLADSRTWLIGLAVIFQLLLPRPLYLRALRWGQRLLGPLFS
ncbi:MAG TPA: glycosyltransferase [Bryobacteraceae bacterium]|nr:glycosyltransferase [Bryobacteraceae bacterium]